MEVLCDAHSPPICPAHGVGIHNPGYWGMNVVVGQTYRVVLHTRASNALMNVSVALTSSDGSRVLASSIICSSSAHDWTRMEVMLNARGSDPRSRLQLTTDRKGVIWFDQISTMPTHTHKGHGFRPDLMDMLIDLEPRFIRFPGGCFVEGQWLRNAFHWKQTVGPWEERPGHFGDVWNYWTDDGLGYFEFLQLAEDLGADPVWVVNNGISHQDGVSPSKISPFVEDMLDSIEFARGESNSTWGSVRASMGHPKPFDLKYVAIGNEDCAKPNYRSNYLKLYASLTSAYPDIQVISNCDASKHPLDHPAQFYDYHIYGKASLLFNMTHAFDKSPRNGPKAFVSEYAVHRNEAGKGNLLAALAEAAFLLGVEKNSDLVAMASYAPLFVNENNRRWNPDAIVFNSARSYGTPSYWTQHIFKRSSGSTLLTTTLQTSLSSVVASAISWVNPNDGNTYIIIKVVNIGSDSVNLKVSVVGLDESKVELEGSRKTVLTSSNVMDENSFDNPTKVVPVSTSFQVSGTDLNVVLQPHSLTSFDLLMPKSSRWSA